MRHEAFKNDGANPNPNADVDLFAWDTTRNTFWQKELIGNTASYNNTQVQLSGGNEITQFLVGANYNKQTTVFPGDLSDKKASLHFNFNTSSLNHRFTFQLTGSYVADFNSLQLQDLTTLAVMFAPNAPPLRNSDGSLNRAIGPSGFTTWPNYKNPLSYLNEKFQRNSKNLITNAVATYEIFRDLNLNVSAGYHDLRVNDIATHPFSAFDPSLWPYIQRNSAFANNSTISWVAEPKLSYSKAFAKAKIEAMLGSTINQVHNNNQIVGASGFSSDQLIENIGAATKVTGANYNSVYKYNALSGRLGFNYDDKYLANFSGRRDGSSRFGQANRFHNFWSIGAGWIFSNTALFRNHVIFFKFWKNKSQLWHRQAMTRSEITVISICITLTRQVFLIKELPAL